MKNRLLRWGCSLLEGLVLGAVILGTFLSGGESSLGFFSAFVLLAWAFCLWGGLRLIEDMGSLSSSRPIGLDSAEPFLPPPNWQSRMITILLPVCAVVFILQSIPLPAGVVGWLSPQRTALAARISQGLGEAKAARWLTLTADRTATCESLLLAVMAIIALWLGCCLGTRRRRARRIIPIMILLVLVEALYGVIESFIRGNPGSASHSALQVAHGSFVNRNHFAGLLALFTPLSVGWFFYRAAEPIRGGRFRHYRMPGLFEILTSRRGLWMVPPVVLTLGILQSASRGGLASMMMGVAVFFALIVRGRRNRTLAWLAALLGLLVLIFALNSDYETVVNRFDDLPREDRFVVWYESLRMMRDFPLFGVGLGNFGAVFKIYTSGSTGFFIEAHNEWLEAWLTLGFIGFIPFGLFIVGLFRAMIRKVMHANEDQPWMLGAFCGLLGIALHSFVEYNFHIPSMTIIVFLLGGLILGYRPRTKRNPHNLRKSGTTFSEGCEGV